ncbi:RNA methyltransferase [Haloechinothrix sp. LS1_15]|uniref:TrmH family RNA methyltransferase n=1 Tax=Haloechinothrix sp. LS1_15 TaxID=2652248 RepID=UPI0029449C0A|nr:RNA methyltransferase [Haloechinothrix sp. LS1_15]MDV6014364.1 RNA methyltransferase [Haloechinothrix sp. LS1_15]
MAELVAVSSSTDPRVDDFRDLTRADRRPDRPGGRGLVIAEGTVVIRRLLASPYPPRALLGVPDRIDDLAADLAGVDVPAYVTDAGTMAEVVGFHLNRGVLAVADRATPPSPEALAERGGRVAVLEGVGDHENLGALFRNAAALGVTGVLLGPGCSDPLYRRSVRVSMGHVLLVPFTRLPHWPGGLDVLRERGFRIAALTPAACAVDIGDFLDHGDPGDRVAVLLGSEGHGLSAEAIGAADAAVRIPMLGDVDSLNIATAGAIAFYELTRDDCAAGATVNAGRGNGVAGVGDRVE